MTFSLIPFKTETADAEFARAFNRLAVALREPSDDSGVTVGIYFDALKDLPVTALEAGALTLMREPGRRFFPTTAEWRTAAQAALDQQLRAAVTPARAAPWQDECETCSDTGWKYEDCPGDRTCGREKTHNAHRFVRACVCRATNRTFQRHQRFGGGE